MVNPFIWIISLLIIFRPYKLSETVWAVSIAVVPMLFGQHMKRSSSYNVFLFFCLLATSIFIGCADETHPPNSIVPYTEEELKIEGKVIAYGSNDAGDIDEMIITGDGKNSRLHFPPHAAQEITALAKISVNIAATVRERLEPARDTFLYELISFSANGKTLTVDEMPPPPPQRGEEAIVSGKASDVEFDQRGRMRSFVIDKTVISLPPHVEMNLKVNLRDTAMISVKGYKRTAGSGFINKRGLTVIRPVSITVDNTTYTIE